jgi:hypothetical protein
MNLSRPRKPQPKQPSSLSARSSRLQASLLLAFHFDGSGDSGVTEEVKCFDSDYYAYDEHEPVDYGTTRLRERFEALVPLRYETIVAASET